MEQCIDAFDYNKAEKLCRKVLRDDPGNVAALETTGSVLLEVGKSAEAFEISLRADHSYLKCEHHCSVVNTGCTVFA